MLPERYLERPLWDDVLGLAVQAGEEGHRLFSGMHHAIAALAKNGNNVIVDHVLVEEMWIKELVDLLSEQFVWLVGVHCPLQVLLEREQARRNRTPGQAAAQFPLVHANMLYDVEVNTSILSPEQCANHIKEAMLLIKHPAAFDQLKARYKSQL